MSEKVVVVKAGELGSTHAYCTPCRWVCGGARRAVQDRAAEHARKHEAERDQTATSASALTDTPAQPAGDPTWPVSP